MIKLFSRNSMIDYVTSYGVLADEYYISILPTGGPKGIPIFKEHYSNVITLVFDDVLTDSIKDKWPDGVGTFTAKAMTLEQADILANFIKEIPVGATINIHCVEGMSRSPAIAAAIENKPAAGNRHVYELLMERLSEKT